MTGQPEPAAPLPDGFKAKGIVALTFSIIAGLLGVAVIAWYGLGEMNQLEQEKATNHVTHTTDERGTTAGRTTIGTAQGGVAGAGGNAGGDAITTAAK